MSHPGLLARVSLALIALAHVALPIYFWDGGLIEREATHFVRQYLDERSVMQKVFDPHANDIGTYQARELSYLFDYVDARVMPSLLARGHSFLVPFSGLLASFLTVVAFVAFSGKVFPQVRPVTATLTLLLYLTNHVYAVTTAVYYRSAKPLLPPLLLTALFYLTHVLREPRILASGHQSIVTRRFVATFALGCTMSLLDRQGFFYAVLMVAGLASWYRARGGPRACLWGSIAAVSVMVFYNFVLGPWLVRAINGYSPSFEYQKIDVLHLIRHPLHFVQAARLLAQSTQIVLGSFPVWLYGGVAAVLVLKKLRDSRKSPLSRVGLRNRLHDPVVRLVLLVAGSQVLMFALMIVRHPPIWDWHDHRLWYYPLPYQVLVLFGMLLLLDALARRLRGLSRSAVDAVLVAMIVGNVLSWPTYRGIMLSSQWFPGVYQQSAVLKRSLEQRKQLDGLDQDYRAFYDYCINAREAAPQTIEVPPR